MFTRIMSVVLAVILLLTAGFGAVTAVTVRRERISARLSRLELEAQDIAYLAAQTSSTSSSWFYAANNFARQYLNRKVQQVYDEYGAYIVVVDRRGRVLDNLELASGDDPEFTASLNGQELGSLLVRVLEGETVTIRGLAGDAPTFTVGVPFIRDGTTLGAVLIRTKAQQIEAAAGALTMPILLIALAALLVSGLGIFVMLRHVLRPLRQLTGAAGAMADGDFSVRVETGANPAEIDALSRAFNSMSERLENTERARREFVANVSHELRSPITSIRGFVEGMEDGTIPEEEHPRYLKLVGDETRRLSKLIGDLLALSRLEREDATLEMSTFDINEMLRRAIIRRMGDLEKKHMEVICDFPDDPCIVRADSDRIEQVVVNLVDNAIKFTPDTGDGRMTLSTRAEDGLCTVTVADNGVGILPEDRPHIFERFFTEDRAHTAGKGTGLGLSICQRIMEMHGQSIRLLDTEEGTALAFTLPLG